MLLFQLNDPILKPEYPAETIIYVNEDVPFNDGDLVLAKINETYICRYVRRANNGYALSHPSLSEIFCSSSEIVGRVVKVALPA